MSDDGNCKNCHTALAPMTLGNEHTSYTTLSCPRGCGILAHGTDTLFEHVDRARQEAASLHPDTEHVCISEALTERDDERKRADHWMAVALAFRDATTTAAMEARDGERDPYLERAQDLYNATARDFGPVAAPNRFFCDACDSTVRMDEDGCCATCGSDTWPVFTPGSR